LLPQNRQREFVKFLTFFRREDRFVEAALVLEPGVGSTKSRYKGHLQLIAW
jgi:hypothetical protein